MSKKTSNKMSRKKKFEPTMYIRVYEFFREGMKFQQVAKAIGIEAPTLRDWRMDDPVLDYAIERGQEMATKSGSKTFVEHVFERLSPELQEAWGQLIALREEPNAEKRADMILEGKGKKARQVLFIHALIHTGFRMLEACRMVGLARATVQKWKESDPEFLQLMDEIHEMRKDFCEGALMGLVGQGDTSAVLFVNKTLNRDRGYDPKITISHEGSVKHEVDLSKLNLPVKILETILQAVESAKRGQLEERFEGIGAGDGGIIKGNRILPPANLSGELYDEESFTPE